MSVLSELKKNIGQSMNVSIGDPYDTMGPTVGIGEPFKVKVTVQNMGLCNFSEVRLTLASTPFATVKKVNGTNVTGGVGSVDIGDFSRNSVNEVTVELLAIANLPNIHFGKYIINPVELFLKATVCGQADINEALGLVCNSATSGTQIFEG